MAENRAVLRETIDALEEGLKRLREYDGRFRSPQPESIFWLATPYALNSNEKQKFKAHRLDDDTILEGHKTLRRYRLASKALLEMSRSLELEIKLIESEIQPMVLAHGIAKIPNEVLALIMRSLCEPWDPIDEDGPQPEDLELVCKRFRDVVYSQSSFRNVLSSAMNPTDVSRRLGRIGTSVGLKIDLGDERENFCTFVDTVIPCMTRWEEVYSHYGGSKDVKMKQAYSKLRDLSLPRLTRLIMRTSYRAERDESDCLFSTWKTPSLREVISYDRIPIGLDAKKTIKLFELTKEFPGSSHLDQLFSFLSVAKSLTSLRLSIRYIEDFEASPVDVKEIKLPNLEKLNVEIRSFVSDMIEDEIDEVDLLENPLYKFISKLETPALEELVVTVVYHSVWERLTKQFLTKLLQSQAKSTHLRRIEFTNNKARLKTNLLDILQSLYLEGTAVFTRIAIPYDFTRDLETNMIKEPPRNLRRLRFKDCSLSAGDVSALLKILTNRVVYPKFEALVLTPCSWLVDEFRGTDGSEFIVFDDE